MSEKEKVTEKKQHPDPNPPGDIRAFLDAQGVRPGEVPPAMRRGMEASARRRARGR